MERTRGSVGRWRRGFGLLEAVMVIVVVVILAGIMLPNLMPRRTMSRQIKDSANIRGIHQGMVLWSQDHQDRYPLPSVLDKNNATVALGPGEDPTTKDTTAAIISVLIYGNFFGPEICVSPAEANPKIEADSDYRYVEGVGRPPLDKGVLWDPAFTADFTAPGGSNFSYAHSMPSGPRMGVWSNTFNAPEAVLGNRGPKIGAITKGRSPNVNAAFDTKSNTLLIHGSRTAWEGNIAYNDNHVAFEMDLSGPATYTDAAGAKWADILFADEADDPSRKNNFLGVYIQAGPNPDAFRWITD